MDQHWIYSNGFVAQIKNYHVFQWLIILQNTYDVLHIWKHFEIGNGKYENNGVYACIKNSL